MSQQHLAIVISIADGPHGQYAITKISGYKGSVTFSLEFPIWKEESVPAPHTLVILDGLKWADNGWRADRAYIYNSSKQPTRDPLVTKAFGSLLKEIKKLTRGSSEKYWIEWIESINHETQELIELIKNPNISDEYKTRAICTLLIPDFKLLPFYWKKRGNESSFIKLGIKAELTDFPKKQFNEFINFLIIFYLYAKSQGFSPDCLDTYNEYLLSAMKLVPAVNQALALLDIYELNDASAWITMDEFSGYKPFEILLFTKGLPEVVKRAADRKMRPIIKQELVGATHPRLKHENAIERYATIVQYWLSSDNAETTIYGPQLFLDQIAFIFQNDPGWPKTNRHLIYNWNIRRILEFSKLHGLAWFPYDFAFYVMTRGGGFEVSSESDIETARLMIEILKDRPVFIEQLEDAISKGEAAIKEHQLFHDIQQEKARKLLEAMSK